MGVNVDDAGHQREALGVDHSMCALGRPAHFDDATVADGHVGRDWRGAAAVANGRSADQQIEHAPKLAQVTAGWQLR